ncbi:DUF4064 domain-containing protein [Aquibacillus halophilus]|uniref:DUF4064 domain-containing protein n=1 Tax=Aquibacillus halophilus TaxID=930132 RepID=A0A6A8DJD9_9BACI|nr:DUF4064 domain-containing protein [Aquibacillus halophilus]MRH43849.1 DUF4064 domain-containing protein [Aquibacillus halophilus]
MNRTGEIVLGIIGVLLYGLLVALGGAMVWLTNNEGLLQEIFDETTSELDPSVSVGSFEGFVDSLSSGGWFFLIASLVAFVLGIVAIILVKGNKMPKVAGIIFIILAVVGSFVTFGLGIIAGIFYLIAGIMCLARKQPQNVA